MGRFFLIIFFSIISFTGLAQQQRLIVYGGSPWFPFDPLSGSYQKGSLAQLAGYVDAWREELDAENVFLAESDNFLKTMPDGYKAFLAASDSTLLRSIRDYMEVTPIDTVKFPINGHRPDTLRGRNVLVIDRWDFFGEVTFESKIVDVGEFPSSKDFLTRMDRGVQSVRRYMSTQIKVLDTVYTTRDCYFGPSRLAGLFHSFQRDVSGADISLFAPPRLDRTWDAGELFVKDVYGMLVYDNDLSVVEATGAQVLEFMEEVHADRYYTMKRASDDLVRIKTPYFFQESAAGMEYWVNVTKSKGSRIENHNIDRNRRYKIAINSFRAKWFTDKGCRSHNIGEYRLLFLKWLNDSPTMDYSTVEQWRVVPERWVGEAARREKTSLFN